MKNIIELNSKTDKPEFQRMKALLSCVSTDPTREVIRYARVEKDDDGIRVIGTDGRRLRSDHFEMEAMPGLYEIKANTAKSIFLVKSKERLQFPDWRQVIPSTNSKDAHAFKGMGKRFVLWVTAGLGCYIDPELLAIRDDEEVTLYIQKDRPDLSPALLMNDTTTMVVMPIRITDAWGPQIEAIRQAA